MRFRRDSGRRLRKESRAQKERWARRIRWGRGERVETECIRLREGVGDSDTGWGLGTENSVSETRELDMGEGRQRVRGDTSRSGPYSGSSWTIAGEVSPASDPGLNEGRAAPQRLRESQPVLWASKGSTGALRTAGPLFPSFPSAEARQPLTDFGHTSSASQVFLNNLRPRLLMKQPRSWPLP